jgi:hypothetical protein
VDGRSCPDRGYLVTPAGSDVPASPDIPEAPDPAVLAATVAPGPGSGSGPGDGCDSPTGAGGKTAEAADGTDPGATLDTATEPSRTTHRGQVGLLFGNLVEAIRHGDDETVETAVLALSQRSRWLAPLALLVGGFAMLFQGVKTLFTNWRLTLVQILPAMWIWAAMLDLKAHVLHGKGFHEWKRPLVEVAVIGVVALITAGAFYLNAVFAFAISEQGPPQIRPAFIQARNHLRTILTWGLGVGALLGFSVIVVDRWGKFWFAFALGIMCGVMMFAYVAVPSRMLGLKSEKSRRDKLSAAAVGGAIGAVICSPPYALGRIALLMLGSHVLRYFAVLLLVIAVVLQTGATSAVKAVKMGSKIVAGRKPEQADAEVFGKA